MNLQAYAELAPKKEKLTRRELTRKYIEESQCVVTLFHVESGTLEGLPRPLSRVEIEFHGALAAIPNMKNRKIPGQNFMNPDVFAKVDAMDALYSHEMRKQGYIDPHTFPTFGLANVHMLFISAKRSRSFDLVGCIETIQDWMEPGTKKVGVGKNKHDRRWGIGLVADDKQITPTPRHSWQVGPELDYSRIIIEPWSLFESHDKDFTGTILTNGRVGA